MPAPVRAIYSKHPQSGVNGYWVDLHGVGIRGLASASYPPIVTTGKDPLGAYATSWAAAVNAQLTDSVPLASLDASKAITPEKGCTVVATNYVRQLVRVSCVVKTLIPLVFDSIALDEDAAASTWTK